MIVVKTFPIGTHAITWMNVYTLDDFIEYDLIDTLKFLFSLKIPIPYPLAFLEITSFNLFFVISVVPLSCFIYQFLKSKESIIEVNYAK